ncbi:MAG: acyl-protein synthetase [Curvibacter sp.]|nr:acyl-protein synthetase [Curvibacter sp.]
MVTDVLAANIDVALGSAMFTWQTERKRAFLQKHMQLLGQHHREHCPYYRGLLDSVWGGGSFERLEDAPFIPVRLFKEYSLKSVPDAEVFKVMTSSGTSGAQVSKIYLDRTTAGLQTKALSKIVQSVIGAARLPMIIVDSEDVIKDRAMFSARGAGILGFSMFGRKTLYALDGSMQLKREELQRFVTEHRDGPILLFGFTSIVWDHFYRPLKESGASLGIRDGVLIHGGGWKKLQDRAVGPDVFREGLRSVCGVERVLNYYGMVEQTGSISFECEEGFLHANALNEILIRRAGDLAPAPVGEPGIIQTLSILPLSYPGHSLLTEDEGVIVGEDNCRCGRMGKYFQVLGRIKQAEIRGCSDTFGGRA